jgi:hypothetical protein
MHDLLSLFLALLVSRRELRFDPVAEQAAAFDCGYAVARALVEPDAEDLALGLGDPSRGLTLGNLASILENGGLSVRPLRLGLGEIDEILGQGFAPIIVNYEQPTRHWALLLGRRGGDSGPAGVAVNRSPGLYSLADPARGLEVLDGEELAGRFGGVAIVIDPASLDRGKRLGAVRAGERAFGRWDGLARLAGMSPSPVGSQPSADLTLGRVVTAVPQAAVPDDAALDVATSLALASGASGLAADARFSVSLRSGTVSMGFELPLVIPPGDGGAGSPRVEAPRILASAALVPLPWVATCAIALAPPATEARTWADAGAGTRGGQAGSDSGTSLRLGLARIMDPLLLEMVGTVMDPGGWTSRPWGCSVALRATEAVSERFFLTLGSELGWQAVTQGSGVSRGSEASRGSPWSGSFSISFSMRLEGWSLGFGFSDRDDGGTILRLSGDWELKIGPWPGPSGE